MKFHTRCFRAGIVSVAIVFGSLACRASDIEFSGNVSRTILGSGIDISADEVDNYDLYGISGTLRLQVWATTTPYYGGTMVGRVLGTRTLGTLVGGFSYTGISGYVPYTEPPYYGFYYTTLTVEEYTGFGFIIRDWVTFDGTSLLGNPTGVVLGIGMYGKPKYHISPKTGVRLKVPEISYHGLSGVSGSLRLQLWACPTYYTGGELSGYVVASQQLDPLSAELGYLKLNLPVSYSPPPSGYYFMVLTLDEYTDAGWVTRSFSANPKLKRFR
jgi:hypothetical protein